MYSARTEYRLAHSPADYRACHAFFRTEAQHPRCKAENEGFPEYVTEAIKYPTVYAVRDEKIVAVMATRMVSKVGIVANPCHVSYDIKNHVPVLLRLIDCYEFFLQLEQVPEYWVVMPNYKPSGRRIWEELRNAELSHQVLNNRFNVYRVQVP